MRVRSPASLEISQGPQDGSVPASLVPACDGPRFVLFLAFDLTVLSSPLMVSPHIACLIFVRDGRGTVRLDFFPPVGSGSLFS